MSVLDQKVEAVYADVVRRNPGEPEFHQAVREFVGSKFVLSTKPRIRVSIDGEVGAETPLEISALADAVTIAVPREPSRRD